MITDDTWHVDARNDEPDRFTVRLHRRNARGIELREGQGTSTENAIAAALNRRRLEFATREDDLAAVIAAFHGKPFTLGVEGNYLTFRGLR